MASLSKVSGAFFDSWLMERCFAKIAPGIFVRERNDIFDVIVFQKSSHGPMFRVFAYNWAPEFLLAQESRFSVNRAVCLAWVKPIDLGPYTTSHSKWWLVANKEQAETFLAEIQAPMNRGMFRDLELVRDKSSLANNLLPQTPRAIVSSLVGVCENDRAGGHFFREIAEELSLIINRRMRSSKRRKTTTSAYDNSKMTDKDRRDKQKTDRRKRQDESGGT